MKKRKRVKIKKIKILNALIVTEKKTLTAITSSVIRKYTQRITAEFNTLIRSF